MKFSFCITTDLSCPQRVVRVVDSIKATGIGQDSHEILIMGDSECSLFDELKGVRYLLITDERKNWITKKKNMLVAESQYENVVLMHDYFEFDKNWYVEFNRFGDEWDICSNAQNLEDGRRHWLDWTVWDDPLYERYTGLCYENWDRTRHMYISGGFYLVKKKIAMENPLNECLVWGQAEDVEWSMRIRNKYLIKCNGKSSVRHCKRHRDMNYDKFMYEICK